MKKRKRKKETSMDESAMLGGMHKGEVSKTTDKFTKKPSITELESLLGKDEDSVIQILPNGEIRAADGETVQKVKGKKPLTYKENLGGEYGRLAA